MRYIKYDKHITNRVTQMLKSMDGSVFTDKEVKVLVSPESSDKYALKPTIKFTPIALAKMKALVAECSKEIAWHGTVNRIKNKNKHEYTIDDIIVFPQTVTAVTVVSDDESYGPWFMELPEDTFNKIRMHGHSHVNMGVTPSATDLQYQRDMLEVVEDYYVYLIMNKRGDIFAMIYDVQANVLYDNTDITVEKQEPPYTKWANEMMDEYVCDPKAIAAQYRHTYTQGTLPNYTLYQQDVVKKLTEDKAKNKKRSEMSGYQLLQAEQEEEERKLLRRRSGGYYEQE